MPPPAARLRWDQVVAWRAARHHLDERVPAKAMLEVAGRIAGPPPARVRRAAEAEAERLAARSDGQLELRWADAG
jgi:hypothetical protein